MNMQIFFLEWTCDPPQALGHLYVSPTLCCHIMTCLILLKLIFSPWVNFYNCNFFYSVCKYLNYNWFKRILFMNIIVFACLLSTFKTFYVTKYFIIIVSKLCMIYLFILNYLSLNFNRSLFFRILGLRFASS